MRCEDGFDLAVDAVVRPGGYGRLVPQTTNLMADAATTTEHDLSPQADWTPNYDSNRCKGLSSPPSRPARHGSQNKGTGDKPIIGANAGPGTQKPCTAQERCKAFPFSFAT